MHFHNSGLKIFLFLIFYFYRYLILIVKIIFKYYLFYYFIMEKEFRNPNQIIILIQKDLEKNSLDFKGNYLL